MISKLLKYVFLTVFAAFLLTVPSQAGFKFALSDWTGRSFDPGGGNFSSCVVSKYNEDFYLLMLRLEGESRLSVGVGNYQWNNVVGAKTVMDLILDMGELRGGEATAISPKVFSLRLPDSDISAWQFRNSTDLYVVLKNEPITFDISGIADAIELLEECVRHNLELHS